MQVRIRGRNSNKQQTGSTGIHHYRST